MLKPGLYGNTLTGLHKQNLFGGQVTKILAL